MKRYILYLDESGSGELTEHNQNLILTGLILEDKTDVEISGYFYFLKKIYKIPDDLTFHSYNLFEEKENNVYLTDAKAKKLSLSLAEFIKISPIKAIICSLDKNKLREFLKMRPNENKYFEGSEERRRYLDLPYEILAAKVFFWFADFLKKQSSESEARGAIVAESRQQSDFAVLRTYLSCKNPGKYNSSNMKKNCEIMKQYVSSIRFENKLWIWPGLELADLFSYLAFQATNNRMRQFSRKGLSSVWNAIQKKIETKDIVVAKKPTFSAILSKGRVRKVSDWSAQVNKTIDESASGSL